VGGEISACEEAIEVAPDSAEAFSRYAHALARSDRVSDCVAACEEALARGPVRR